MDTFVKRFQCEKYELWRNGKEMATHPEEPLMDDKPVPLPLVQDFLVNIK